MQPFNSALFQIPLSSIHDRSFSGRTAMSSAQLGRTHRRCGIHGQKACDPHFTAKLDICTRAAVGGFPSIGSVSMDASPRRSA